MQDALTYAERRSVREMYVTQAQQLGIRQQWIDTYVCLYTIYSNPCSSIYGLMAIHMCIYYYTPGKTGQWSLNWLRAIQQLVFTCVCVYTVYSDTYTQIGPVGWPSKQVFL